MMNYRNVSRVAALGLASLSLAGCLGNGGNGGGGGPTPPPGGTYQENFDRVSGVMLSTTALTGTANYSGQVNILTNQNPDDNMESVTGDLDMTVNFDGAARPIEATAGNFAGRVGGQDVTIEGTLSTAGVTSGPNDVPVNVVSVPVAGQPDIIQTGLAVTMEGTLSESTSQLSGDAQLTLLGNFTTEGRGAFGTAGLGLEPSEGPDLITGGTFWADRN
jgi:hypothetical protein